MVDKRGINPARKTPDCCRGLGYLFRIEGKSKRLGQGVRC